MSKSALEKLTLNHLNDMPNDNLESLIEVYYFDNCMDIYYYLIALW